MYNLDKSCTLGLCLQLCALALTHVQEVGAPNTNLTIANNIVVLSANSTMPMVEWHVLQGSMASLPSPFYAPNSSFPTASSPAVGRRMLRTSTTAAAMSRAISGALADGGGNNGLLNRQQLPRRKLQSTPLPFAAAAQNLAGTQGRNPDGSCPNFPDSNPWHVDVTQLPVRSVSSQDSISEFVIL